MIVMLATAADCTSAIAMPETWLLVPTIVSVPGLIPVTAAAGHAGLRHGSRGLVTLKTTGVSGTI